MQAQTARAGIMQGPAARATDPSSLVKVVARTLSLGELGSRLEVMRIALMRRSCACFHNSSALLLSLRNLSWHSNPN